MLRGGERGTGDGRGGVRAARRTGETPGEAGSLARPAQRADRMRTRPRTMPLPRCSGSTTLPSGLNLIESGFGVCSTWMKRERVGPRAAAGAADTDAAATRDRVNPAADAPAEAATPRAVRSARPTPIATNATLDAFIPVLSGDERMCTFAPLEPRSERWTPAPTRPRPIHTMSTYGAAKACGALLTPAPARAPRGKRRARALAPHQRRRTFAPTHAARRRARRERAPGQGARGGGRATRHAAGRAPCAGRHLARAGTGERRVRAAPPRAALRRRLDAHRPRTPALPTRRPTLPRPRLQASRSAFPGGAYSEDAPAPVAAAAPSLADRGIVDADAADNNDPNAVTDYVNEIYAYYRSVEVRGRSLGRTGAAVGAFARPAHAARRARRVAHGPPRTTRRQCAAPGDQARGRMGPRR